jgi:hypothetical protein
MPDTTVTNIHRRESFDVYVGRPGQGREGPWGNPIPFGTPCRECGRTHQATPDGRVDLLFCFARMFLRRVKDDSAWADQVFTTMKGKRLGCFCAPQPCHAAIYAAWCDGGTTAVQELLDRWRAKHPHQEKLFLGSTL